MGEDSDLKAVFYAVNGLSGEMKPLGKAQLGLTELNLYGGNVR